MFGEEIIAGVLIAVIPTIITAIVVAWLAVKSGFSPLTKEVREERGALVATLRQRMDVLEAENLSLHAENKALKVKVAQLEADKRLMSERIDRLEERLLQMAIDERLGQ